eukprot:s3296_g2.t1
MFQATKPEHEGPRKWVMILGFLSSSVCGYLGYPCVSPGWITRAFRATCVGYFSCNLIPYLLGPCNFSTHVLRTGMIINSISSFIVSAFWCIGFGEWVLLMLMVHVFQIFGVLVLVETDATPHVLFTMSGNIVSYLFRAEMPDVDSGIDRMDKKLWAACIITTVVLLVGGMWKSNHRSIEFLKRKFSAMSEILALSNEEMEKMPQNGPLVTPPNSNFRSGSTRSSGDPISPSSLNVANGTWIEGLETLHCVGQGAFGSVYFCRYNDRDAAVKVMTWQQKKKSKVNPIREAELCLKLRHPNLVQTYTFFTRDVGTKQTVQEMWIIQEWCDLGTLNNYASSQPYQRPRGRARIKDILIEIVKATAYLHASDVIHGDLTSNNVLLQSLDRGEVKAVEATQAKVVEEESDVSDSFTCKVCDFGMARVLEEGITELLTSQLGTVSHMPPELLHLEERRLSKKADIWAIGMLLYEIVAGEIPYKGMMIPSIILFVATGKRLSLPEHVEKDLRDIFNLCQVDLEDRPSAEELLSILQEK